MLASCHFRGWWYAIAVPYPFRVYETGCGTGYGTLRRVADPLQLKSFYPGLGTWPYIHSTLNVGAKLIFQFAIAV